VKDNTEINNKWLFIEKQWIPIIKLWFRWDFIPQQWIVTVFWNVMNRNVVELDYELLQKISDWSDIPWNYWLEGNFVCVKWNSIWLFLAKQVKNLLKMKL
jgi:NOL1/NOP2/fmu family ribosome biogenesis protein